MEAAPTNTSEPEHQQEKNKEREQNRNFWIAVVQGAFIRIAFCICRLDNGSPCFYLKTYFLKHACRLDRLDDASGLDVAPNY